MEASAFLAFARSAWNALIRANTGLSCAPPISASTTWPGPETGTILLNTPRFFVSRVSKLELNKGQKYRALPC